MHNDINKLAKELLEATTNIFVAMKPVTTDKSPNTTEVEDPNWNWIG